MSKQITSRDGTLLPKQVEQELLKKRGERREGNRNNNSFPPEEGGRRVIERDCPLQLDRHILTRLAINDRARGGIQHGPAPYYALASRMSRKCRAVRLEIVDNPPSRRHSYRATAGVPPCTPFSLSSWITLPNLEIHLYIKIYESQKRKRETLLQTCLCIHNGRISSSTKKSLKIGEKRKFYCIIRYT